MAEEITLEMMRESLYAAVVQDALDRLGYPNQSPRVELPPIEPGPVLIGRCRTTLWVAMAHEDPRPYEMELQALDDCRPDDVFVAAAEGSMHSALWGELLSTAARARGAVGAIIDGAVRDVARIREIGFPVHARGRNVYDSANRHRVVDIDVTVEIAGVPFEPGALVIADEDGIVVVPREIEFEAVAAAWAKVHAENEVRDAIAGGMLASEAFRKYGVL